jgi:hypothetical protein
VWRRHPAGSIVSHHALRASCVEILPLVEMYCKYVLLDDCSGLRALMLRFDSEVALKADALGRSLLLMLRDDDVGLRIPPAPHPPNTPSRL